MQKSEHPQWRAPLKRGFQVALLLGVAAMTSTATASARHGDNNCGFTYIPNGNDGTVSVIDMAHHTIKATLPAGEQPAMNFAAPDGSKVFVSNFVFKAPGVQNTFQAIDTKDNSVKSINLPNLPFGAKVSHDSKRVYWALYKSGVVQAFDTRSNDLVKTFTFKPGEAPMSVETSLDDKILYVSFDNSTVGAYDAATGAVLHEPVASGPAGSKPAWISLSANGRKLFSLNASPDSTTVIDTRTFKIENTTYLSGKEGDKATPIVSINSPDGKKVYVSGTGPGGVGGIVQVLDARTGAQIAAIHTAGVAEGVSFTADGKRGFITHNGEGSLPMGAMLKLAFSRHTCAQDHIQCARSTVVEFDPATDRVLTKPDATLTIGIFGGTPVFSRGAPGTPGACRG